MDLQHAAAVLDVSKVDLMGGDRQEGAPILMPDNALDGFRNGAILDLRVRFAMELLVHSPALADVLISSPRPKDLAACALDCATELFALAQARGLVQPLGEVDEHLMAHIRRQVVYQVETQKEQQRQAEESNRIAKAVHGAFRGK